MTDQAGLYLRLKSPQLMDSQNVDGTRLGFDLNCSSEQWTDVVQLAVRGKYFQSNGGRIDCELLSRDWQTCLILDARLRKPNSKNV